MGTNNPKVSAYVPELLKERLTQFREERGVSESQAVTIILAEYFQIPEVLGRSPEGLILGGVTLARMEALEEKVANLSETIENRFQKLEGLVISSGNASVPQVVHSEALKTEPAVDGSFDNVLAVSSEELIEDSASRQESNLDSELPQEQENDAQESSLLSEPSPELLIQPEANQVEESSSVEEIINLASGQEINEAIEANKIDDRPPVDHQEVTLSEITVSGEDGSSNSEPPENSQDALPHHQNELPFELQGELPIEFSPLSSVKLSRRFRKGEQVVKRMRTKHKDNVESFTQWTQDEDPDKIAWEHTPKGYVPIGELTDEQRNSLLNWYKGNL